MGVERWFERKHSDLRAEAKNHLDRSSFSVGAGLTRPRVWPRRATPPAQRRRCAMSPKMMVE